MGNKHFARSPLLYIQQPTNTTPVAPMQHNYYTPKHRKNLPDQIDVEKSRIVPKKRNRSTIYQNLTKESVQEEVSEDLSDQIKFKDMTIKQKVNYFISRPDHAPTIRCEIKTSEKKYTGVITDFENDQVLIRVGRRSASSDVPLNDITDIRIIGF